MSNLGGGCSTGAGAAGGNSDDGWRPARCWAVLDDVGGGDGMVAALGAVGEAFCGRYAVGGGVGEVVLVTVDSWARQGRRYVGGSRKD